MAEFHKNQVAWDAPEAKKVTLAKPDYTYLANAMNNLAKDSQYIADAEQKRLDDALAADMNHQLNLANDDIENARSDTGDFDYLGERALSRLQGAFNQYDESTRRRFLIDNPHYMDNVQLAISEKILKRKAAVIENGVKNELPQWASQAAMIGTKQARQDLIYKIQDRLGNISNETVVNNMIFSANQMFDKYNVSKLISMGTTKSLDEAEKLLRNPKELVTFDPFERQQMLDDVNAARKDLAKQKASASNPQAKAIIEAYALLRQNGFNADADQIYKEVLNTENTLIQTSADGLSKEINGSVVPLYLALDGVSAVQRAEIAKDMESYDKYDPRYLDRKTNFLIDTEDALNKFQVGYDNKDSTQSMALAALQDIKANTRMFKDLPEETQKKVARIIKQNEEAKTEMMEFNTEPFRDVGLLGENASRVYSEQIAAAYLEKAAGPKMSYVPDYMRTRNKAMEDLFQMSFAKPQAITPVERDIYDVHSTGSDMANFVLYGETRQGDSLVDAVLPIRNTFYKDIEDNTTGEYALLAWESLVLMKKNGVLEGTRFDAPLSTYTTMFDSIIGNLKANNGLNMRTTDESAKEIIDVVKALAGRGATLTSYEEHVLKAIEDGAAGAQVNRKAGNFMNWWNKNFARDTRKVYVPSNANPHPKLDAFTVAMEANSKTSTTRKAIKAANKKLEE